MAISFVGAGAHGNGAGGDFTCALPAGVQAGDILIFVGSGDSGVSVPAGWAAVPSTISMYAQWKRAAAGEVAPTITSSGYDSSEGRIFAFRGCKTSGSPIDASAERDGTGTVSASVSGSAITTTGPDRMIVVLIDTTAGSSNYSNPANGIDTVLNDSGSSFVFSAAYKANPSGTAAGLQSAPTLSAPSGSRWDRVLTLALIPAPSNAALAATPSSASTVTAALTTTAGLAASANAVSAATAEMNGASAALVASAAAVGTSTANLTTQITLVASPTARSTATASMTASIQLSAAAYCETTATATLPTSGIPLQWSFNGTASAAADLSTQIRMAASASATASAQAHLTTENLIRGDAVASSNASASLTVLRYIAAAASLSPMASANLTNEIRLRAAAGAQSAAVAWLSTSTHEAPYIPPAPDLPFYRQPCRPQFFVPAGSKDISFLHTVATESSDLFNRPITVRFMNREKTPVDPLYGETKNAVYSEYCVRANVELTPKKATLTKMGIDEPRDLLVFINVGILKRGAGPLANDEGEPFATERGGYPEPEPGDLFIIDDEEYKILDHEHWDYAWHTEEFASHAFACERQRARSVDDAVPADPMANPDGPTTFQTHTDSDFPGEGN